MPTNDDYGKLKEMLLKASEFHGHICPGLAIGCIASKVALDIAKYSEDEELVAIVENDACGVDAIQVLTGCTFGKGNLVFRDHGKSVYTFYNREKGTALRLSMKSGQFPPDEREKMKIYFEKLRAGTASNEDVAEFREAHRVRAFNTLAMGSEIFNIESVDIDAPKKARIHDSIICDNCREPVMKTRLRMRGGRNYCIPCFEKTEEA